MPDRVSKSFKDISLSMKVNPLTRDLITLSNERAIARSIQNLVLTIRGERFFESTIGSKVSKLLFENMDPIIADQIKEEIRITLENYEPRAKVKEIRVDPDYEENRFDVTIVYLIVGIDALPQQLSFTLLPTR